MNEKFLHYVWQFQKFSKTKLRTTDGEHLIILDCGKPNIHAGPDFLHAKIKIGDTIWAGHVEIHINSTDWYAHKHQQDEKYKSVILML